MVACEVHLVRHSSKPPCAASAAAADADAANGEEAAHVRLDRTGSAPDPCEAQGGAGALDVGSGDANAVPRPSAVQLRLSMPGALSGALAKHALGALVASNARANNRKASGA